MIILNIQITGKRYGNRFLIVPNIVVNFAVSRIMLVDIEIDSVNFVIRVIVILCTVL